MNGTGTNAYFVELGFVTVEDDEQRTSWAWSAQIANDQETAIKKTLAPYRADLQEKMKVGTVQVVPLRPATVVDLETRQPFHAWAVVACGWLVYINMSSGLKEEFRQRCKAEYDKTTYAPGMDGKGRRYEGIYCTIYGHSHFVCFDHTPNKK